MKKRFLTGFLAAVLCLSAVGCGSASAPAGDTAKAGNESAKETEGNAKEAGEKAADVSWPDGNVNLIVAAAAGGGTDLVARKVAEIAKKETGANFIVVNQAEGGGAVAIDTVYQDDEDALNLGFFIPSFFTSYITGAVDVKPLDDFKVANYVNRESCAYICVKADSKYKTMEELLDDARKNPESIVFGTSLGSRSHFRVEEFAQAAGVKFKYVEAGKTAEAISAILGGHIEVTSLSASSAESYAKNGDIRILACSDEPITRSEINQDAPTYAQMGYTDLKCLDPVLIVTSKNVPDEVVVKINEVMVKVFSDPELKDYMLKEGTIIDPFDFAKSQEWYKDTFNIYDSVGETLGVKAAR